MSCKPCGYWSAAKEEKINETIEEIVRQSGGFSDQDLLDTCKAVLEVDTPFGKEGILDPVAYRQVRPPDSRTVLDATESLDKFTGLFDWKKRLREVLDEHYVQCIAEEVVSDWNLQDYIADDYFQDDVEERVVPLAKQLIDAIMDAVSTLDLSSNKRQRSEL